MYDIMKIILCGLPGSGKTTVGKLLAEKLNGSFIDNDQLIEHEYLKTYSENLNCRQIFIQKGANFFRKLETSTLVSLASQPLQDVVIALGGGALENPDNIKTLKTLGTLVYLKANPKKLFERIQENGLPGYLDKKDLQGSFEELSANRISIFENASDIHIEADELTPEAIANQIIQKFPKKLLVTVTPNPTKTPIIIQRGFLESEAFITHLKAMKASWYVIITDTNLENLYGKKLLNFLKSQEINCSLFTIPTGEVSKTREVKQSCENHLLNLGCGRDTCIIGLGGGVIGDLVGFVASTYYRGVPAIIIPTSLLAMVDSSIGGKSGVNVPEGKNLIGTICQPHSVLIDTTVLETLPQAEMKNGIAEMIKHALIADKFYFNNLMQNSQKLLDLDPTITEKAIYDSIVIKTRIVQKDPTEFGMRRLLNFGHTFAHAIEAATQYAIPHGRAVAIGVMTASYLSMQFGYLPKEDFSMICDIFDIYQIDVKWKNKLSSNQILDCMRMDKKSKDHIPRFVLIEQIGKPMDFFGTYCTSIDEQLLIKTLNWMCSDVMQCH
jgi:3-dehydroquinate synthase